MCKVCANEPTFFCVMSQKAGCKPQKYYSFSELSGNMVQLQLSRSTRNSVVGFGCSLGFLYFVSKFNDVVQSYKASRNIKKRAKIER